MSLTSVVNDRDGLIWQLLIRSGGDKKLAEFCQKKTAEMQKSCRTGRIYSPVNDRMTVGMAMRYAMMEMWGLRYVADHPVSQAYAASNAEDFAHILASFGMNKCQGFLFLALLDKQSRGGYPDPFFDRHWPLLERGIRTFDTDHGKSIDARIMADVTDIRELYDSMLEHFKHPSIVGRVTTCAWCGVTQIPEKVWTCKQCGAPLTYNGVEVSGLSLSNKPDYQYTQLNPTYANEIGGSDAPLAIAWRAFSIRTVSKPIVTPEHILMAWGWWALYDERECPPWQTATVYYARQRYELTFEFQSLHKMLGIDLKQFHSALRENYSPEVRIHGRQGRISDWIPNDIEDLFGQDGDPSEFGDW